MSESMHKEPGLFKRLGDIFSDNDEVTEEEILSLVEEAAKAGVLKGKEASMIKNVFSFDDKDAKDIMIHRGDIEAVDGEDTLREAIAFFEEHPHSRFPVYLENLDNIIGIIHLRDMFRYSSRSRDYDKKIRDLDDLIRPALFIPETHGINTLFSQMQHKKSHIAVVMDEYGQTSGLVSMEDILEEIVGDIEDEHDNEEKNITRLGEGQFRMTGHTTLEEAARELGVSFEDEEATTLNGFLTGKLGRIPEEHESFGVSALGWSFRVLDVKDKVIQDVVVKAGRTAVDSDDESR